MYSPRSRLETPIHFDFPHTPYDIQQQLMESLFTVLEQKGIGIFESPTGTGKSLTLTCSALRWLLDHEELVRQDLQCHIDELTGEIKQLAEDDAKASDWITAQHKTAERRQQLSKLARLSSLQQAFELKLNVMRERRSELNEKKHQQNAANKMAPSTDLDDGSAADYFDELQLVDFEGTDAKPIADGEEFQGSEEIYKDVKIFFCSRTHSQLAQVVREVKRTAYGQRIRCVSLASRQQLCINPQVRRLRSVPLINERCLDLASKKISSKVSACDANGCTQKKLRLTNSKCCFKAPTPMQELSESSLLKIQDIEDLVLAGERVKACPYYAARQAMPYAQLIMLPYQLLLHRKTRLQSGIDLQNSVIIIDEAHNLLDTIAQIHSAEISLKQLAILQQQITGYKMRYASQLSTANLLKINQLAFIIKRLIKLLNPAAASAPQSRMLRTHELMSEGEFFNINVFHILEFCERTRFAQKLQGFSQRNQKEPKPSENQQPAEDPGALGLLKRLQQEHMQRQCKRKQTLNKHDKELTPEVEEAAESVGQHLQSVSVIRPLLAFLETLTDCAEDGRVLISINATSDGKSSSLKYVLLNPGEHFKEIVEQARAIIIAGGTLQPTAELTDQLFKSCPERLVQKFYDHVVSADSVLPFVVAKGPTGKRFCFNFTQRSHPEMLSELGMTLQNLCNVIPAGVVCFFPSYDFLETVYTHLQKLGFLDRILQKKRIFHEPRSSTTGQTIEQILIEYAATIKRKESQGALLLSVVGGKLSEGLNFADDLGRCVVVVGMPYPNRNSPELQERMKYLDITLQHGAGSEYYENLCMKAVNQCIGRSVRHIRDYASVMLVDERYGSERVQRKLPHWIMRSLHMPNNFGMIQGATARFFKQKKLANLE